MFGLSGSKKEERSQFSVSDPALVEFFQLGNPNYSGVTVNEQLALSIPAVWRAVSLISQTIAQLDVSAVRSLGDGTREAVPSWMDRGGAYGGLTRFEFMETVMVHLLLHGNSFCAHLKNGAGGFGGLFPVHPLTVSIEIDDAGAVSYLVKMRDGSERTYTDENMTHLKGPSVDGVHGLSVISVARNSLGTAAAGERSSSRMFSNGGMMAGMVTPEEDVSPEEMEQIKHLVNTKFSGWENAGAIVATNKQLKFQPWMQTAADSQFLESRRFSVEEVARWFGVPPHLLMQTEKQTSWGSGVAEQNRGLARTVLGPWASRIEQRLERLIPRGQVVRFDFASLEKPTPEQEIDLLIRQVQGGLITVNEARAVRNMAPVEDGDKLFSPAGSGGAVDEENDQETENDE